MLKEAHPCVSRNLYSLLTEDNQMEPVIWGQIYCTCILNALKQVKLTEMNLVQNLSILFKFDLLRCPHSMLKIYTS